MAIVYYDMINGNDSSGTGTYSAPYKTLAKATIGLTGGDEVRCAVSPQITLSGTLTFTNESATVTTSVDLTSEVQTGDIIRHPADNEAWWSVASVTASTIVLGGEYWGTDGAGKTGYRMRVAVNTPLLDETAASSGTSPTSLLKISGGWNLSTQTRTGFTFLKSTSDIPAANQFTEYSHFIINGPGVDCPIRSYIHDIHAVEADVYFYGRSTIENIWISNADYPLYPYASQYFGGIIKVKDVWVYSSSRDSPCFENGHLIFIENLNVFNQSSQFLYFYYTNNVYFKNCTFRHQTAADGYYPMGAITYYASNHIYFYNCVFDDLAGEIIPEQDYKTVPDILFFIKCTFTNMNQFQYIAIDSTEEMMVDALYTVVPASGDAFEIFREGGRIYLTDSEGTEGKCLKFTPQRMWVEMRRFVGAVKIVDDSFDIELSVYMKKTADFDGEAYLYVIRNGCYLSKTTVTLTTSYVQQIVTITGTDLVEGEWIALHVGVRGEELGSVYVDDFLGEAV